jgi:hypothetical protein
MATVLVGGGVALRAAVAVASRASPGSAGHSRAAHVSAAAPFGAALVLLAAALGVALVIVACALWPSRIRVPRNEAPLLPLLCLCVATVCPSYGHSVRTISAARSKPALSPAVLLWRAAHGLIAIGFLASIGYVWWCAFTGRRRPLLRPAIAALVTEGVLVVTNRGNCPMGAVGDRIGDPVPLFELVLSPRAARRAVPTLGVLTAAGLGLLAARSLRGLFGASGSKPRRPAPA